MKKRVLFISLSLIAILSFVGVKLKQLLAKPLIIYPHMKEIEEKSVEAVIMPA